MAKKIKRRVHRKKRGRGILKKHKGKIALGATAALVPIGYALKSALSSDSARRAAYRMYYR